MTPTIGYKLSRPFGLKTNALLNKLKVKPTSYSGNRSVAVLHEYIIHTTTND